MKVDPELDREAPLRALATLDGHCVGSYRRPDEVPIGCALDGTPWWYFRDYLTDYNKIIPLCHKLSLVLPTSYTPSQMALRILHASGFYPEALAEPTPVTDAAYKRRIDYTQDIPNDFFESLHLHGDDTESAREWIEKAPPDGWTVARKLERTLSRLLRETVRLATAKKLEQELGSVVEEAFNDAVYKALSRYMTKIEDQKNKPEHP